MSLSLKVCGSKGDLYDIVVARTDSGVRMTCSCPAAAFGLLCHHRLELLTGDFSAIVSGDLTHLGKLRDLVKGDIGLQAMLGRIEEAEQAVEQARRTAKKTRAELGRYLNGF